MSFDLPTLPLHEAGPVFAVLFAAILVAPSLARRTRVPELVVLVLLGFAVGPTGIGLVERSGVVATLGTLGLLYLMFVAGAELDLDDFAATRRRSLGFGAATFAVPMVLGTLSALALGYAALPALLLASCWASHTLLTYPVFRRAGTASNRAVATAVGATIVTDTAALLVLAVVARAFQGSLTPTFWLTLLPSLALLTVGVLVGLPRLARWFFSGPGQDRNLRFLFVMVALFAVASLAELIGIEAIVGAFLAGLALNRSVPNGGALMERIDFVGGVLFVPVFLLATGMLIDPSLLLEPRTLLVGGVFTAVATSAKWLAAVGAGRAFGFERSEIGAMFALSNAQAAATLAALVVGLEVGLLDTGTVNAVLVVIVVTCLMASTVASRVAPRLPRPVPRRDLGDRVVVPLANPDTATRLVRLASEFARADAGLVIPVLVAPPASDEAALDDLRVLERRTLALAQSRGAEARSVLRIDTTPQAGIAHTVLEQQASLLVLGWKGATARRGARFGGITDGVLERTRVPTLLSAEGAGTPERVLLVVDGSVADERGRDALRLAIAATRAVARDGGLRLEVVCNVDAAAPLTLLRTAFDRDPLVDLRGRPAIVADRARPTDVVVLPALGDDGHLRGVTTRLLGAVPEGASVLVAIAEVAAATPAPPPLVTRGRRGGGRDAGRATFRRAVGSRRTGR